eukprot:TRINITY_DN48143_c0_g1_i1.p1 TRINITY_DN48143_c0_g1~~TRINITY_DN48143_c0_g1_i1.p1  ORF type:complete len:139 (+),score=18.75 TRINITY_DN48143_c0_g1_i1:75-491(+)
MSYAHFARLPKIQDGMEDGCGVCRVGEKEFARRHSASSRSIFKGCAAKNREISQPMEDVRDWYLDTSLIDDPDWWMFQKYRQRRQRAEKKQRMLGAESELPMFPEKEQEKLSRSSSASGISLSGSADIVGSRESCRIC